MIPGAVTVGYLHPGHYSACFAESLTDLLFHDLAGAQRVVSHRFGKMGKECGTGGIVDGRNKIAATLLDESESEWLLVIDSDMGFAPDTLERLLYVAHPERAPIVGGLAFALKSDGRGEFYARRFRAQPTLYDWHEDDERAGFVPRFDYPPNEVVPVAATGSALVLIHRDALDAIRARFGDHWYDPVTHKGTTFSEDLSFCIRAAACDLPMHVHTGVKTTHDKGGVFLDEDTYRLQQAMREVA